MQLDALNAPITRQPTSETKLFAKRGGPGRGEPFAEYVALLAASRPAKTTLAPLVGLALIALVGVLGWLLVGQLFNGVESSGVAAGGRYGDPNRAYV